MHEIWIAIGIGLGLLAIPLVIWLRRKDRARAAERLSRLLETASEEIDRIQERLSTYVSTNRYLPERERRPLATTLDRIQAERLDKIDKLVKRVGDQTARSRAHSIRELARELDGVLSDHNDLYIEGQINQHAGLLLDDLQLDEAQRQAVVRDDLANLVIGGAGSGKTRVLTGRVRYLAKRGIAPEHILAVTFTNKARDEMRERLEKAGIPVSTHGTAGVTISTLHALGKQIVQATLLGPISVADERWTNSLVAGMLRAARKGTELDLTRLYVNALVNFYRNEDERAPDLEADKTYRTLRGEHVRSVGERVIADFLFAHNVQYVYEARARWAKVGEGRDAYHPDFLLPEINANIEYWGVDRQGNVASWMRTSSNEYQKGMKWKRKQFQRSGRKLIEFYDYERVEGTLETRLRELLNAEGVELRSLTIDQLGKAFGEMKKIGSIIERLLSAFLTNARALRRGPEEIKKLLRKNSPRVKHFGRLGAAILERYESQLSAEGRIDFADMLHRAADILKNGDSPLPRYEHILVDEFQDTSAAMAHLLKTLVSKHESHIFAVGDDWQAIYGFAGGDVDYIVNFEDHFGPASSTMVSTNYRSPAIVVEAGAALIAKNEKQVPKEILIRSREPGEAWVHEVPDNDDALVQNTLRLIRQELETHEPGNVLVISRTGHILQNVVEACRQSNIPVSDPRLGGETGVRILSAHKSKGLEAPVLIIVNASDHVFGFPSKVENPDVLEPVRVSAGNDEAEERRLFYVAITRAMKRLHLITRQGRPSPYIAEIEATAGRSDAVNPTEVREGARFSGKFTVERLFPVSKGQTRARIRQVGIFATDTGRLKFTSWASVNLETGATYTLNSVIKGTPYRGQDQVKLDRNTRVDLVSRGSQNVPVDGARALRPRPPSTHRPRRLK